MEFSLTTATEILERTPAVLETLLNGLSAEWIQNNEGGESWSPFDIIGHLIHGEKTDWIVRAGIILSDEGNKTFATFDRFAQFEDSKGKTISQLLTEFRQLRNQNLAALKSMSLTSEHLTKKAIHPELGDVTLEQLLATWVTHDLGHLAQISRVMSKQYKNEVGPWRPYLPILDR